MPIKEDAIETAMAANKWAGTGRVSEASIKITFLHGDEASLNEELERIATSLAGALANGAAQAVPMTLAMAPLADRSAPVMLSVALDFTNNETLDNATLRERLLVMVAKAREAGAVDVESEDGLSRILGIKSKGAEGLEEEAAPQDERPVTKPEDFGDHHPYFGKGGGMLQRRSVMLEVLHADDATMEHIVANALDSAVQTAKGNLRDGIEAGAAYMSPELRTTPIACHFVQAPVEEPESFDNATLFAKMRAAAGGKPQPDAS